MTVIRIGRVLTALGVVALRRMLIGGTAATYLPRDCRHCATPTCARHPWSPWRCRSTAIDGAVSDGRTTFSMAP